MDHNLWYLTINQSFEDLILLALVIFHFFCFLLTQSELVIFSLSLILWTLYLQTSYDSLDILELCSILCHTLLVSYYYETFLFIFQKFLNFSCFLESLLILKPADQLWSFYSILDFLEYLFLNFWTNYDFYAQMATPFFHSIYHIH